MTFPLHSTAKLREMAYQAQEERLWQTAAILWEQAIDAYPAHNPKDELALRDKAILAKHAEYAAEMALLASNPSQ